MAFDTKWAKVRKDTVKLPNGLVIDDYYVNVKPDVVLIFPVTKDNKVVMVRQYKHGANEILLEFPGGFFEAGGETAAEAAIRELKEETGYHSSKIEELGILYENPTKDNNRIHFFLIRDAVKKHDTEFDSTEDIETVEIPLEQLPEMIKNNTINVAGAIALYYKAITALKG